MFDGQIMCPQQLKIKSKWTACSLAWSEVYAESIQTVIILLSKLLLINLQSLAGSCAVWILLYECKHNLVCMDKKETLAVTILLSISISHCSFVLSFFSIVQYTLFFSTKLIWYLEFFSVCESVWNREKNFNWTQNLTDHLHLGQINFTLLYNFSITWYT